jgi:hypothetical protein
MEVSSRQVSSSHALMGSWSRRSEMPSSGEVGRGVTISLGNGVVQPQALQPQV